MASPFESINQTQAPVSKFAQGPVYTANPAVLNESNQLAGNPGSSPIKPVGSANPPSVGAPPSKNAKQMYNEESFANSKEYTQELHQARARGMAGVGAAQNDELKAKYSQKFDNEWDRLSPEQQAEKANGYVKNGDIDASHAVNTSRIAAFKANQGKQTANESLNGIAAGKGGNSWDNNSVAREKGRLAIQNMIAEKTAQGVNPYTNEYVGIAPTKDITNEVASDLSNQSTQETDQSKKIRGAMTGLASRGQLPLVGAQALTEQAQSLDNSSTVKDVDSDVIKSGNEKVTATPYGIVQSSTNGNPSSYAGSTNSVSSGIADMKNQQAQGGTPIAEMLANKVNKDLTDPSGDKYAAPVTPPPNPTAQETDEEKKKRMQGSNQPSAPAQAAQATPTAPSSSI